jgi:formylglycine-generating enzyme required for sulfatase activity
VAKPENRCNAARAGTSTPYPWGSSASHEYANYGTDTVAGVGFASGRDKWLTTSPVGAFPSNQFGLYDMHGNVLQWVEDCFSESYNGLPTDGSAYKAEVTLKMQIARLAWMNGKSSCSFRICRGGNAWDHPPLIRSASRNWGVASTAGLGFRVAKSL